MFVRLLLATACCLLVAGLFAAPASGAPNPFITPKKQAEAQARREAAAPKLPAILQPFIQSIAKWQFELRKRMAGFARDIREAPFGASFWLFMLLSFAYGALHALGPGHGKVFAVSYFLNRPGGLASGMAFAVLSMFCHVLSAAVAVLAGKYILETSMSASVDRLGETLELVSYGLLTSIGVGMFVKTLWDLRGGVHAHSGAESADGPSRGLAAMALAAGIVPCPGAALVLIFSISLGIQATGLLALFCISLGMALTISAFAAAAIVSRGSLLRIASRRKPLYEKLHVGLSLAGSLAIVFFGGLMLAGLLGAA